MSKQYLVRFDADKIKEYVFATGRLKEIRGASALVRELTDAPLDRLKLDGRAPTSGRNPRLLFAGGASGALLFDDEGDADTFCRQIERLYRRATGGATLSAIVQEYEAGNPQAENQAREAAERKLANRKASRPIAESLPGGGPIRFCASDRRYPASRLLQLPGDPAQPFSVGTVAKHKASRGSRRSYFAEESEFWQALKPLVNDKAALWQEAGKRSAFKDIDAIGTQSTPPGYIAFVYADGDGIGAKIRQVAQAGGLDGYASYSRSLSKAAANSAALAIHTSYPHLPQSGDLPFELITIGGDDVMLICTAEQGLHLAVKLSEQFQAAMKELAKDHPATASVGVVIAHTSHPIVNLRERAGELLKSAKQQEQGGIDFHIVSTPSLGPLEHVRREDYVHGLLRYTDRPYDRQRMMVLLKHASKFRTLPGSKRMQLYEACMDAKDRVSATLNVLQVHSRMAPNERKLVMAALYDLGVTTLYPFIQRRDRAGQYYATPLIDLIEAAEFVSGEHP